MHEGKGGRHYKKHGEREVCELMEDEAIDIFYKEIASNLTKPRENRTAIKKALWAAMAVKHELRAGTKEGNSIEQEHAKAENYRHRQETGEWLK